MSDFGAHLRTSGATSAGPYGYTLTIWGSGMVCADRLGSPDLGSVLLFVIGAVVGFVAVEALAYRTLRPRPARREAEVMAIWGSAHLPAAGGAVLSAWAVAQSIGSVPAWFLASALATATYLALNALETAAFARRWQQGEGKKAS